MISHPYDKAMTFGHFTLTRTALTSTIKGI